MGGRIDAANYRFSFNGKESDDEVVNSGDQIDYGMRVYNTRLARFISVDPLYRKFPSLSPYHFASNRPILAIDLDGAESTIPPAPSQDSKLKTTNSDQIELKVANTAIITSFEKKGDNEDAEFLKYVPGAKSYSFINQVSEVNYSSTSEVVDVEGVGLVLRVQETEVKTTVTINVTTISSVTQTTNTTTSYTKVNSYNKTDNTVLVPVGDPNCCSSNSNSSTVDFKISSGSYFATKNLPVSNELKEQVRESITENTIELGEFSKDYYEESTKFNEKIYEPY